MTNSRTINEGDILYTVVGSFGIPVKVNTAKKFCVQRHIAILKPDDHIVSDYLFQGLKSNLFYKQAADVATGTAQKTVSLGGLRNIKLPLPPLAEQFQIVSEVERRLSIADEVEQQISTNLKRAERMRQSILKKAFSGRLVPQDPGDEPAEVLLEKIKQAQRA